MMGEMTDRVNVGAKVKHLRAALRIKGLDSSQDSIAELINVSRATVSAYENRSNANPSPDKVAILAEVYEIDIAWFYDGKDTPCPILLDQRSGLYDKSGNKLSKSDDIVTLTAIAIYTGKTMNDDQVFEKTSSVKGIATNFVNSKHEYALLQIEGSALSPRLIHGDLVLVRFSKQVASIEYGTIVTVKVGSKFSLRRYSVSTSPDRTFDLIRLNDLSRSHDDSYLDVCGLAEAVFRNVDGFGPNIEWNSGQPLKAL